MSLFCFEARRVSVAPGSHVVASRAGASGWRDVGVFGAIENQGGTEGYVYFYQVDATNWYRLKVDWYNGQITVQRSVAGVITDLSPAVAASLFMNAAHPFKIECLTDPRTTVPCVAYAPGHAGNGLFADKWSTIAGSPAYGTNPAAIPEQRAIVLAEGDEVRAIEDVVGPCLNGQDTIMSDCSCEAITMPPTLQFDMSRYAVSFKAFADADTPTLEVRLCWDYDQVSGLVVRFDWAANEVRTQAYAPGGVGGSIAATSGVPLVAGSNMVLWCRFEGDDLTVGFDLAGTPTTIATRSFSTSTFLTAGDFGFVNAAGATGTPTVYLQDVLCVPYNHINYIVPQLINFRSNDWLRERDGANGALDGLEIGVNNSRNFIRATVNASVAEAFDNSFNQGAVGLGAEADTSIYLPYIAGGPILTACRHNVAA